MKMVCSIEVEYFTGALAACVEEHNAMCRAGNIKVLSQGDGCITFSVAPNLIAFVRFSDEGGETEVNCDYQLTAGDEGESHTGAKVAARATTSLIGGGFLFAAVWGVSYLLGNRNPWYPLLATGCLWIYQTIRLLTSRSRAKRRFEKMLSGFLSAEAGKN